MKNLDCFDKSCATCNSIVFTPNPEGYMVISKNSEEQPTVLEEKNNELIELIISYKKLKELKEETSLNLIVKKIIQLIENTKLINYSAFCVYMQVKQSSYSYYIDEYKKKNKSEKEKIIFFKEILDNYIKYRHNIYTYHNYTNTILQVMADASSSRRNSKTGIAMIEEILTQKSFKKETKFNDFIQSDLAYALPDKGNPQVFLDFLEKFKVNFTFRKERDNKNPDILLKIKNHFFIIEHKLASGTGGAQNSEINEIISFIKGKEENKNIHYISCLDGRFFSYLAHHSKQPKTETQLKNIAYALTKNPNNYFLNSNVLSELIDFYINTLL